MLTLITEDNNQYYEFHEPIIDEFRNAHTELLTNMGVEKTQESINGILDKIHAYLDWYIEYSDKIIGSKNYSEKTLCSVVFNEKIKTNKQMNDYLRYSLYISRQYVEHLKSKVISNNVYRYKTALGNLDCDLEWLILKTEIFLKKTNIKEDKDVTPRSFRSRDLKPRDIFFAARNMFFIEEIESIQDIYLRDFKPVTMFNIRQLIELYGKNLLGYFAIRDIKTNEVVKKFTQVSWEFISEEIKRPNSRIQFPFDAQMIISINKWSNSFVHSTYLYPDYMQFFALNVIRNLFIPSQTPIEDYTGEKIKKMAHAEIKISQYDSLKKDFENYLNNKLQKKPKFRLFNCFRKRRLLHKKVIVDWMDVKRVEAYIISL